MTYLDKLRGVAFRDQKAIIDKTCEAILKDIEDLIDEHRNISAWKHPDKDLIIALCNEIKDKMRNLLENKEKLK